MTDLDRYLDDLVEWANEDVRETSYTHFVVEGSVDTACDRLAEWLSRPQQRIVSSLTGSNFEVEVRKLYLAPAGPDSVLVWDRYDDTGLMEHLSRLQARPLHWVSIDEGLRAYGYLRFESGELAEQLLEPREMWTTTVIPVRWVKGEGPRRFTLCSFHEAIASQYVPPDRTWNFGKWDDPEWRLETIRTEESLIDSATMIVGRKGQLAHIEEIPPPTHKDGR